MLYLGITCLENSTDPNQLDPETRGRLDLAVLFTPSTPNRQNRNQVRWNICAGVRWSTPSSKVVQTEQSRDLFQNKMAEHCLHCTEIFFSISRLVLIIIYIEKYGH